VTTSSSVAIVNTGLPAIPASSSALVFSPITAAE
jgi:hypothetical protein